MEESFRDPLTGKPKNNQIANLGKVDQKTLASFQRMGYTLLSLCGISTELVQNSGIKELGRCNYGYVQVVNKMLVYFIHDTLFNKIHKRNKFTYNVLNYVVLMAAKRLPEPRSTLAYYHFQGEYRSIGKLELHQFYRSLSYLAAG